MSTLMNRPRNRTRKHATREDFCQVFQKDLTSLYQLALLLTADHTKAESILVAGLDECADGNPVFRDWARSWARRIVITSAIRLIMPTPGDNDGYVRDDESEARLRLDGPTLAVARLSPFDRFAFIMSVLERIPDRECAELLGCGTPAIEKARVRALQAIGDAESPGHEAERRNPALVALEVA